jgi:Flp pilus assembly protein TadG
MLVRVWYTQPLMTTFLAQSLSTLGDGTALLTDHHLPERAVQRGRRAGIPSSSPQDHGRRFSRLSGDERGVSAVEFALIAPVIIAFYFGLAEFCQGYMAQKRMGHALVSRLADLVAQQQTVATANLDDILAIGGLIMKPFSATTLKQRVSSVTQTPGVAKVVWSRAAGCTARYRTRSCTVPAGLIANDESIIVAEATYDYDSPVKYLMPAVTVFAHLLFAAAYREQRALTTGRSPDSNCFQGPVRASRGRGSWRRSPPVRPPGRCRPRCPRRPGCGNASRRPARRRTAVRIRTEAVIRPSSMWNRLPHQGRAAAHALR